MSNTEAKSAAPTSSTHGHTNANPVAAFAAFDPMAMWSTTQHTFHKMMADTLARAEAFSAQYAALEAQMIERAQGAVANWAQLAQDAIAYSAQLATEARKLGLETARQVGAKTAVSA